MNRHRRVRHEATTRTVHARILTLGGPVVLKWSATVLLNNGGFENYEMLKVALANTKNIGAHVIVISVFPGLLKIAEFDYLKVNKSNLRKAMK